MSALMSDSNIQMCSDAALILLAMVRSILNPVSLLAVFRSGLEVMKLSCSTQLSMKFKLLLITEITKIG